MSHGDDTPPDLNRNHGGAALVLIAIGALAILAAFALRVHLIDSNDDSPTSTTVPTVVTTIPIQEMTCEQLVDIDACAGSNYATGYANWHDTLPAFVDSGVLGNLNLPDSQVDYARTGFGICALIDSGSWVDDWFVVLPDSLANLTLEQGVQVWNTAITTMCPAFSDEQATVTDGVVTG